MKEIIEALTTNKAINIPLSAIAEFYDYVKTLPDLYSFSCTYPDGKSVNMTLTEIIPRDNEEAKGLH